MEFLLPSFSIFFSSLLFIFLVLKLRKKSTIECSTPNLPPGPRKLPIIGNIHQMVSLVPHQKLRDLAKKHGPLMHLQLGEISTVVISSPEMATEVLKTHDIIFATRPHILAVKIMSYDCSDIAFAPYGAYWRQLRKICILELLSMRRVQSFQSIREEEVSTFIKSISLSAGTPINLTEKIFSLTYGIISRSAVGKKTKEQEILISIIQEATKLAGGFRVADLFPSIELLQVISGMKPKLEKMHKIADEILEKIINEHKVALESTKTTNGEAVEDLLDVLLKHQEEGKLEFPLTTNNIKAVILDMFTAGSDTSSTTVEWAMAEMLKNPRVLEKAQAEVRQVINRKGKVDETEFHELKYLKLVIKESLRLHPSGALLLPRECQEKCEINGYDIPVKTNVIVNAWAIGRDPKSWPEPESFIPERFLDSMIDYKGTSFEYIPFGAGRRMCPGIIFGMANVEHILAELLYHFNWKLPFGKKHEDLDMTEIFGVSVKRREDLLVIPTAYYHK